MSCKSVEGYNRLAPVYRWLEYLVFGQALMKARLALLDELSDASHILVLGEGDGRFLTACLKHLPVAHFTVVEQSAEMIRLAKTRVNGSSRVQFVEADIFSFLETSTKTFDAVVTCFFLDLFEESELERLFRGLNASLQPGALWYNVDFCLPASGFRRLCAAVYLRLMIGFFAWQTGFKLRELVNPHCFFLASGFTMVSEERRRADFLLCQLYQLH